MTIDKDAFFEDEVYADGEDIVEILVLSITIGEKLLSMLGLGKTTTVKKL
ncbi:MAG: hypothetical protein RSF83_11825 [Hungatella sp.]